MLDLYKLQIFSTVVQEGSFSAAAERLYMTQSAVSQHIKELEAGLGRQLFQRGWRGVSLTPHGEILNQYTNQIFELVGKAENALVDVNQLTSGRISIGATPGIGVYLAPDWVQRFRGTYPHLTVALQTAVTSEVVAHVLGRQLDIGFIEGELEGHTPPQLAALVLEEVEQQVVVGFKHPFWECETIQVNDLHNQSLIVREVNSQSRIWLEDTLHLNHIDPVIGAEFDNLESIKRAVALGRCLAVLPPYVVQAEVQQNLLHMIPVEAKPFVRSLKLIWDKTVPLSPITNAFLLELSSTYPALKTLVEPVASLT